MAMMKAGMVRLILWQTIGRTWSRYRPSDMATGMAPTWLRRGQPFKYDHPLETASTMLTTRCIPIVMWQAPPSSCPYQAIRSQNSGGQHCQSPCPVSRKGRPRSHQSARHTDSLHLNVDQWDRQLGPVHLRGPLGRLHARHPSRGRRHETLA